MKKIVLVIVAFIGTLMLTGCGAEEEKVMNCTRTLNQSGVKMDLKYTVKYKGNYVTVVQSEEKVTTDDVATLEAYKEQVEKMYSVYDNIEHYNYDVAIDGNTLTSKADINYEKIDTDKLIEIDSAVKQLIKDGKILVSDIESVYTQLGATCEK